MKKKKNWAWVWWKQLESSEHRRLMRQAQSQVQLLFSFASVCKDAHRCSLACMQWWRQFLCSSFFFLVSLIWCNLHPDSARHLHFVCEYWIFGFTDKSDWAEHQKLLFSTKDSPSKEDERKQTMCVCVCVCVCQRKTKDRADGMREKSAHFPRRDSNLYLWDKRPPCFRLHYEGKAASRQSKPTL